MGGGGGVCILPGVPAGLLFLLLLVTPFSKASEEDGAADEAVLLLSSMGLREREFFVGIFSGLYCLGRKLLTHTKKKNKKNQSLPVQLVKLE